MPNHETYIKDIQYYKNWYINNKLKLKKSHRKNHIKIKKIVIKYYSKGTMRCMNCKYNNIYALSIDHIHNNGNEHRRILKNKSGNNFYYWLIKNNFPSGYKVLCMNCQFIKKHRRN